jgi:cysteine desulfurase
MKRIYLDHAATTPLDKRVAKAMADFELKNYGNPSSVHREGQDARAQIDFARASIAGFIAAKPQEIIFTSGATEANNMAILGVVNYAIATKKQKPHVITTELEHHSVYNTIKELEKRGAVEATFIKPSPNGLITSEQVMVEVKSNTVLVSVIFVSNEIGSVLPVREIGKALSQLKPKPAFHIDAVQAEKFYNCNVEKLECDLLTLSAHKVYGPKGIGALYAKTGLKMQNLTFGGAQEYGRRPGTQNTAGIIGFAKSLELLGSLETRQKAADKIAVLRDKLISGLLKIKQVELNGPKGNDRTADNVSITVHGVDQDAFMTALDLAGIAGSTGSACVSGSSEPSHVIAALGKVSSGTSSTLRLTLGKDTKLSEITAAIKTVAKITKRLRD